MLKRLLIVFVLIALMTFLLVSCNGSDDNGEEGEGTSVNNGDGGVEVSDGNSNEGSEKVEQESEESNNETLEDSSPEDSVTDSENTEESDENTSDGKENEEGKADTDNGEIYVYSVNSKKYHLSSCYHAASMNVATRVEFSGTCAELSELGFIPCKICKPDPNYDYTQPDGGSESGDEDEISEYMYVLNGDSKKFHLSDCSSADSMKEENKIYSNESRDELVLQGYSPCGKCKP